MRHMITGVGVCWMRCCIVGRAMPTICGADRILLSHTYLSIFLWCFKGVAGVELETIMDEIFLTGERGRWDLWPTASIGTLFLLTVT